MNRLDLSVIIVNYNVKYFLEQCLCSVIKACNNIEAEIFVVDNHSTDGSREYLESKFPEVYFRWNKANMGFAKANNSVLGQAKGAMILFLNPDTILPEDCFDKCLDFFKLHKNCGALGVRMIDGSGKYLKESKRSFPSPITAFFKMTGLATLFPSSKLFAKYYAGHLAENKNHKVDVLAGAFLMIDKKVLDKVSGFDENYFMYGEDVDLSYCIQNAGFDNYYISDTTIIHFKGESTQKATKIYIRQFYGAMQLFVKKHYKEQKVTYFLMLMAIRLSKFFAIVKLYIYNTIVPVLGSRKIPLSAQNTLVVASQQYFDEMIQFIKYAEKPLQILGRIATDKNDPGIALGKLEDLHKVAIKNAAAKIIFCEGEIGFKMIIELIQQVNARIDFLFHAKKSTSIVGSNHKNEKGIFIAKN